MIDALREVYEGIVERVGTAPVDARTFGAYLEERGYERQPIEPTPTDLSTDRYSKEGLVIWVGEGTMGGDEHQGAKVARIHTSAVYADGTPTISYHSLVNIPEILAASRKAA